MSLDEHLQHNRDQPGNNQPDEHQRFQVGVKAVITQQQRLLVAKHTHGGSWDLIGGRIATGGEAITQALRREILEELPGVTDIRIGGILAAMRLPGVRFPDTSELLLLLYSVDATIPATLSTEHCESRWVTAAEATQLGPVTAEAARVAHLDRQPPPSGHHHPAATGPSTATTHGGQRPDSLPRTPSPTIEPR
ncbi:NUDIX domain-containing protein [Nocardia sp. alder85J]|uniref:NUDIX domain-containing protein n=1 Tax=Nocardia sp. alder85J TaxID=2862949 RepID=UPI001CD4A213|nr:NUDIX domain-containing protein [Nocardia sp. alder85J]MCX4094524.1 NUDIX domain-containing protein [Nocardia sp. alder85J]